MGLLDTQKKTGGLLASAPTPVSKETMDFFAPSLSKGPSFSMDSSTSPTPTGPDTLDFLRTTGQSIARNYIAVGQGIVNTATGQQVPFTPSGKVQAAIFGTDKPISLQSVGEEYPFVPKGSAAAPIVAGFGAILDLVGGGEAKGIAIALKEADTAAEAAKILRTAGFAEDIIKDYAPVFAGTKSIPKIEEGLKAAETLHNTTVLKAGPDVADMAKEGGLKVEDVQAATKDWEETYAPKAQELSDKISGLQTDLKNAKAVDRPAIQAELDAAHGEAAKIEDSFLQKWGTGETKLSEKINPAVETATKYSRLVSDRELAELERTGELQPDVNGHTKLINPGSIEAIKGVPPSKTHLVIFKNIDELKGGTTDKGIFRDGGSGENATYIRGSVPKDYIEKVVPSSELSNASPTREPMAPGAPGEAAGRPTSNTLPEQTLREQAPETSTPSLSDQSSLESAKQVPTEVSRPFARTVNVGAKNTSQPTLFKRAMKTLDSGFTKVVEYVQDDKIRVKKLLEGKGLHVSDSSNPYQKMTLYPGRVAAKVEEARAQLEGLMSDMVNVARDSGRDVEEVRSDVNEYLQAVHAPERNAALKDGAAGMTNEEAKAVVERIHLSVDAPLIRKMAADARKLNEEGLVLLRDSGVISTDLFDTLTKKYPNHVPLQRIFENEPDVGGALSIRGFDVKSSGLKRAKGSEREVNDIVGNIQHNYEQAVIRSEKNIVDQATLGFVRENRDALEGLMEVRKPKVIGRRIDDFKNFDKAEGALIMERTNDPSFLQLFEDGKPVWVKVTDPALAVALRGVNREKLPALLNTIGAFTRFYAGLATRFNPEFAFPNKIRDIQETMIYMAAQKDVGFKGAGRMLTRDPGSVKAVFDGLRGADTPGARLYQEMKEMGGTTGGFGLSTRKQVELDMEDMLKTAQSKPRQAAQNVVEYIDHWNTIFEDSTRLSVYKQALAQGATRDRAASLAKEASINFNRMGRGGPVINAIWMFSNASIQGSAKMLRSLKNPKVLAAVTATVGAAVGTVNEWNDSIDPDWRNKITKWDRLNGLPIVLPSTKGDGASYVVIPVSWGMKPIKVMADYAYDAATGKDVDLAHAASDFFTSVADAYNPLGGTDLVSSFTPTVLDVPVEIVRNQSWSGSKIHPDFDKNAPRDIQYFSSLGETATGRAFIETTKELQKKAGIALSPADMAYAFDQYIGGAGKAIEKTTNTALGAITGKPPPADEFPFVSRFYRTRTQEEVGLGAGNENDTLKGMLQSQSRENFYKNQGAEDQYAKMKALPKAEADAAWKELVKEDPETAKKIIQLANDDKKGLNYTERLINQLGVKDGQRALYLKEKFDELKTPEDKAQLWKSYVEKGIITKQIADQVEWLMKHATSTKQANAGTGFDDMLAKVTGAKTAYAAEKPDPTYYIRDNEIKPSDLDEAKAVLFGEISNRTSDKQQLEAQTILNTAFNRMDAYRARGINKTLAEVLQQPNQYQAYKGKEYDRYKTGQLHDTDHQKLEAIDAMLAKVKNGTFQNNIGNYVFYSHKPDGRIVAINKPLFL